MKPWQERLLKTWVQRRLRLSQGKPGSLLRAAAAACGKRPSTLANEINPAGAGGNGRVPAKLGVATLVRLCEFTRDAWPLRFLARCVRGAVRGATRAAKGRGRKPRRMEVAA